MATFSRRQFVGSAAAGTLLTPFLPYLARGGRSGGGVARAAIPGKAKRVFLFCTMGTYPPIWKPTAMSGENITTFSAAMKPLEQIRDSVVMVEGCPTKGGSAGHGSPDALTGLTNGDTGTYTLISVDQFIADKLAAAGIERPIPSLLVGANTMGATMFMRRNRLTTVGSPKAAFNTVFSGVLPTGTSADKLLRRRRSTLDLVKGELGTVRGRLAGEERAKLDLHLESIRQLENQLTMTMPPPMNTCMKPATTPADDTTDTLAANVLHLDVIANAFACDITRVAGIQFGADQNLAVNLPSQGLQGDQHNGFIHSGQGDGWKSLIAFEAWLAQRFVDVAKALKARPDPSGTGTLYDSTLMVWARDMGDADQHNSHSMKFVLAGGAGGYLKTSPMGRYFARSAMDSDLTSRHERVLLSILDAMGITSYTGFGSNDLGSSKSPLPGIAA
jgi:hypothetical protein